MHDSKTVRSGASNGRRLFSGGLGLLLLGLAVLAGYRGIGLSYVSLLEHRAGSTSSGTGAAVLSQGPLESPRWGLGEDADFAYLGADALLAQYQHMADSGETDDGTGAAALAGFRHVLRLRPVWARGWARLAYAKAVLGERDPELFQSLAQALRFGPHEQEVRAMVAWVGLSEWDHLPQPTKQLVWSTIMTAIADPMLKRDILRRAVDFGLSDYLLPHLDEAGLRQLEHFRRQRAARDRQRVKGPRQ